MLTLLHTVCVLVVLTVGLIVLTIRQERQRAASISVLMRLLSDGACWRGLELVQASDGFLKRGTVYIHLGILERRGLVTSEPELLTPAYVGITRNVYRITGTGRRWYAAQLSPAVRSA